jgi:transposase
MRLDYSSKFFVCALPAEQREGLYQSHIDAFQYLEGVAERIRYGNMKKATRPMRGTSWPFPSSKPTSEMKVRSSGG